MSWQKINWKMNGKWKFSWNICSQHNMCSDSNDTIDFRIWFWLAYLILLAMVLILKILHVLSDPICCLNDTIWHLIKSYTVLNTLKRHQVVFKFYIQQKNKSIWTFDYYFCVEKIILVVQQEQGTQRRIKRNKIISLWQ